jgi:hypothetical protein
MVDFGRRCRSPWQRRHPRRVIFYNTHSTALCLSLSVSFVTLTHNPALNNRLSLSFSFDYIFFPIYQFPSALPTAQQFIQQQHLTLFLSLVYSPDGDRVYR